MDLDRLETTDGIDVKGKRVLVRVDLNVPVKDGTITDATRLTRIVPTVRDLARRGAKVVLISHFGRPKDGPDPKLSLKPVAARLGDLLGTPVMFAADCVGEVARKAIAALQPGQVAMLENLRFYRSEEKNDANFARELAELGDIYVNDAFSCAHRAHASTEGLAHLLPAYAGPSMIEEINALRAVLDNPKRPVAAVVGGAKVSTKIPILENLLGKVDKLIIGGGMANTFLQAQGMEVGKSLAEPDFQGTARQIMEAARAKAVEIVLPIDGVVAGELRAGADHSTVDIGSVPKDGMILDVGPKSRARLVGMLESCRTLLWNGPLGAFEVAPFGEGTFALARAAAARTKAGRLVSIAGGGDTVAALNAAGVTGDFTYVSTAGGAFLEWLEGRELPGVAALVPGRRPSAARKAFD
jgi:phosphoglycerate kinase